MSNTETSIEALGWSLEEWRPPLQTSEWRARQRNFFTEWRESPELVLKDLQAMRQKQAEVV